MLDLSDLSSANWQKRRQAVEALLSRQPHTPEALHQALLDILRTGHQDLGALNAALQVLTRLGVPVTAGLARLLRDPNAETRALAALALGEQRDPQALPLLLQGLQDANTNVRFNSLEALGKLGRRQAVEPLLEVLQQGNAYLSFPAIQSLGQLGDPTVTPTLVELLQDEILSLPAAEALGRLGDPDIIPYLAAWLDSPQGDAASGAHALGELYRRCQRLPYQGPCAADLVQARLGQLIGRTGRLKVLSELERTLKRLERRSEILPAESLTDLVRLAGWLLPASQAGFQPGERARLRAALEQLLSRSPVNRIAVEALQRLGEEALPDLLQRLEDPDPEVRHMAAAGLGSPGNSGAVPALLALLDTPDPSTATTAAGALGRIGDPAAFHPLCAHLDHPAAIVRQAILAAIHSLGHPDLTPTMLELAQAASPHVREAAIKSLAYFGAPGSADAVLAALHDADEAVQKAAIEGLPFIDDPRTPAALAGLLPGASPVLRAALMQALGHFDPAFAFPYLLQALDDPDPWTRLYACRSLANLRLSPAQRKQAVERFLALLDDPMPPVRSTAATALGRSGDPRAVSALQPLLHDPENDVRLITIEALAETHRPQAVPLLAALAAEAPPEGQSGRVPAAALAGLGRHGSRQALAALQKAALNPATRRPALLALANAPTDRAAAVLVSLLAKASPPAAARATLETLLEASQASASANPAEPSLIQDKPPLTGLAAAAHAALRTHPASPHARRALTELLYRLGALYEPDLLADLLADPEAEVRQTAILALVDTRAAGAAQHLARLAADDPAELVRRTAHRAGQYLQLLSAPGVIPSP